MDDEYQNPENKLQKADVNEAQKSQHSSEIPAESTPVFPESNELPKDSVDISAETAQPVTETAEILAESAQSLTEPAEIPVESVQLTTETVEIPVESVEISTEPQESASTDSLESSVEISSSSPVQPAISAESSAMETPDSDKISDRDDYVTGEPPKLKYYDEAERQEEINKYKKFKKVDGETYRKVNVFLRKRTYITAREWALARLCADFKTPYGSEMTFIGEHLPELCPFMQEPYSPQAVNQARTSFKLKVRKSAATFLYGAMCGFFTPEELDDILFEANEVANFFLEIEGTALELDEEIDIEDKISKIMKGLGSSARSILKTRIVGDEEEDDDDVIVVPVEESTKPAESAGGEKEAIKEETKPVFSEKEADSFQ